MDGTEILLLTSLAPYRYVIPAHSEKGRKHGALRPQKPLRLSRDGEVGGGGQKFQVGSCVSHFNVSLIVWAKSQDIVHKPQFLKTEEPKRIEPVWPALGNSLNTAR